MEPPGISLWSGEIVNDSGEPVAYDLRTTRTPGVKPVVIVCHSFMAFKEWGFFPHACARLAERGFAVVSFNFARNGVPPGGDRIEDFDRFADNSFSAEIADLGRVVRAVREGSIGREICDAGRIALLGHSRGGGVAIVHASRDQEIAALVTWAAVAKFDRWTAHQKAEWRKRGFLPLSPGPGPSPLRLGTETLRDLDTNGTGIDPLLRAPYITVPWLILHGRADVTVPPVEAAALAGASGSKQTKLEMLDAVGHLFNGRSPDEDHYMTLNHVISLTADWLRGVLP